MSRILTAVNFLAVIFSLIWLAGHSSVRVWDWEFWFAAGYLTLAVLNLAYFLRRQATHDKKDPSS